MSPQDENMAKYLEMYKGQLKKMQQEINEKNSIIAAQAEKLASYKAEIGGCQAKMFTKSTVLNNSSLIQFYCGTSKEIFEILYNHLASNLPRGYRVDGRMGLLLLLRSIHRNTKLLELQHLTGIKIISLFAYIYNLLQEFQSQQFHGTCAVCAESFTRM